MLEIYASLRRSFFYFESFFGLCDLTILLYSPSRPLSSGRGFGSVFQIVPRDVWFLRRRIGKEKSDRTNSPGGPGRTFNLDSSESLQAGFTQDCTDVRRALWSGWSRINLSM